MIGKVKKNIFCRTMSVIIAVFSFIELCYPIPSARSFHLLRVPLYSEAYLPSLPIEHRNLVLYEIGNRIKALLSDRGSMIEIINKINNCMPEDSKGKVKDADDFTFFVHGSITTPERFNKDSDVDIFVLVDGPEQSNFWRYMGPVSKLLTQKLGGDIEIKGLSHRLNIAVYDRPHVIRLSTSDGKFNIDGILRSAFFTEVFLKASIGGLILGNTSWDYFQPLMNGVVESVKNGRFTEVNRDKELVRFKSDLDKIRKGMRYNSDRTQIETIGILNMHVTLIFYLLRLLYEFERDGSILLYLEKNLKNLAELSNYPESKKIYFLAKKSIGADRDNVVKEERLRHISERLFKIYDAFTENKIGFWQDMLERRKSSEDGIEKKIDEGNYIVAYEKIIGLFQYVSYYIISKMEKLDEEGQVLGRLLEVPHYQEHTAVVGLLKDLSDFIREDLGLDENNLADMIKAGEELLTAVEVLTKEVTPMSLSLSHPSGIHVFRSLLGNL